MYPHQPGVSSLGVLRGETEKLEAIILRVLTVYPENVIQPWIN